MLLRHCFEWLQHCYAVLRSKPSRLTSPLECKKLVNNIYLHPHSLAIIMVRFYERILVRFRKDNIFPKNIRGQARS